MSDTPDSDSTPPRKRLSLDDFIRSKKPVQTSLGELYVRHALVSDVENFIEGCDDAECGRKALVALTSREKEKRDTTPLDNEDVALLNDADVVSLAKAITERNHWGELPKENPLDGLGQLIKQNVETQAKKLKETMDSIHSSIARDYSFLSNSALDKLNEQVSGIAAIRSGIPTSALESLNLEALKPTFATLEALKLGEALTSTRLGEALSKQTRLATTLDRFANVGRLSNFDTDDSRIVSAPPILTIPTFEETSEGRVAIENARSSKEVAERVNVLTDLIAELNQTLILKVLPTWFNQAKSDAEASKESLKHATKGIQLAIVSIFVSAVISIGATWWQVSIARDVDRESAVQQEQVEKLLREQLATQQQLIKQQEVDAELLRGILRQQAPDTEQRLEEMTRRLDALHQASK